jgi:diguanylate cyclase (GGDEF)-like protein
MTLLSQSSILIVDDVPSNIQVLAEALRQDYQVRIATNGADALAIAHEAPPDLILLDVMMPGMDGFEVCRRLKSSTATQATPVVFITAKDDLGDEEQGLSLGAVDYITKPFHLPVVRARVRNHLQLKLRTDMLERMAHVDGLTGIANRRRFDEALDVEIRRCQRAGQSLSLLLIDIDYFKHYNDHYGHGMGDLCLSQVAASLAHNASRAADLVARYGGEEFAVILPQNDLEGARLIAERLRERVLALEIPHAPSCNLPWISISIGAATVTPPDEIQPGDLINAADRKLYEAKSSGRNCVRL